MTIKKAIEYRKIWMGVAMLWIITFHMTTMTNSILLRFVKHIGYGGVDIFLFASGIGNYYSYLRDENPLDFLARRLKRLAPTYVPFIIIWMLFYMSIGGLKLNNVLGNLLGIQNFTAYGRGFNWYLTALWICYLITPYLSSYVNDNSFKRNFILLVMLIVLSSSFWGDDEFIISATRIPIYVIGMLVAKYADIMITLRIYVFSVFALIVGIVLLGLNYLFFEDIASTYGLYWYPFIVIAPSLCLIISRVSVWLDNNDKCRVLEVLNCIGSCSFELYLVHIFVIDLKNRLLDKYGVSEDIAVWSATWITVFVIAFVLKKVSLSIRENWTSLWGRKK